MKLTDSENDLVRSCLFQPLYSGEASEKFWKEVRHPANERTLYDLGCALQDLESRVLAAVNEGVRVRAEKAVVGGRKKRPRRKSR